MPREAAAFPERPSVLEVIHSSTLFNSLAEEDFDWLAQHSHLAFADRSETIWMHGHEVDFFGLVGVGFVKMVMSTSSGQELAAELMGPGQIFGLLGVVEGAGCPLSARAVTQAWYLKIPKRGFMDRYPTMGTLQGHLLRRTTSRLRNAHEMMARMSSGKVASRLAAILFILADSYGKSTKDGLLIDVPLTRQDLGDMAGTTVETTIRVMSRWQKDGVVSSNQRHITILDEDRLAAEMT